MKLKCLLWIFAFLPALVFAQQTTTFIQLPGNLGYAIDSLENRKEYLVSFIPAKQFHGGALMQLADSSIVFRIMMNNTKDFRYVYYSKSRAEKFLEDLKTKTVYVPAAQAKDETILLSELTDSGTTAAYKAIEQIAERQAVVLLLAAKAMNDSMERVDERGGIYGAFYAGIGVGEVYSGTGGLSTGIKLSVSKKLLSFGLRYCGIRTVSLFGDEVEFSRDVSLLAGVNFKSDYVYCSAMIGFSYVMYQYHGKFTGNSSTGVIFSSSSTYESINTNSTGIPIDVQIGFFPHSNIGFGIGFYTSISKRFYFGELFTLRFGRLLPELQKK